MCEAVGPRDGSDTIKYNSVQSLWWTSPLWQSHFIIIVFLTQYKVKICHHILSHLPQVHTYFLTYCTATYFWECENTACKSLMEASVVAMKLHLTWLATRPSDDLSSQAAGDAWPWPAHFILEHFLSNDSNISATSRLTHTRLGLLIGWLLAAPAHHWSAVATPTCVTPVQPADWGDSARFDSWSADHDPHSNGFSSFCYWESQLWVKTLFRSY